MTAHALCTERMVASQLSGQGRAGDTSWQAWPTVADRVGHGDARDLTEWEERIAYVHQLRARFVLQFQLRTKPHDAPVE